MHHRKAPKEPDFIRLDQVWSKTTSRHELHETPKACTDNAYEGYLFHVRRSIDSSGKHRSTVVDIQCELIQECLRQVMGKSEESGIEEENMVIDPDILFLYLEDIRSLRRKLKDIVPSGKSRKMLQAAQDLIDKKRRNLKVLVKYLEADYKQILNKLKPLLQNGLITFDLLWTLWRPNTLAFTDVYGEAGELQVFRVGKCQSRVRETRTTSFWIKGTYVDFDGKRLGRRNVYTDIDYFRGTRKINRLNVVPLQYHQNSENVRRDLIERGKKFVQLSGVLHKSYQGPAFWRAQASIIRREVHGRVMIDAGRHPQNNPLGVVAPTRSQGHDSDTSDGGDSSGEEDSADNPDSDGDATEHFPELELLDGNTLSVDMNSQKVAGQRTFVLSDEDYLLASPLVLGYSLQENTWAEFLVSGVKDISWNAQAYDFVVLEPEVKSVIKALADTQKRQATDCFDQDITGRGKGFIALLHGPSGTGKTLTVTAISEVLKCPLYTISTNEMGSSAAYLAAFLRQVFENCRSWGAILLISDADVYLENRTMRNTHRNSIVNVFLRQLSSFCGTMFLKTARVEEFDDELRSHVHVAVRYGKPDFKSKKAIFRAFLGLAPVGTQIAPREFTDTDLCELAKYDLNGRHIRNTVTTAQALAVAQGQALDMVHFRQVLEVAKEFERDIKGGPAFEDAMNSYC
ncbi:P-loop containing nucleoside triphosphate hydrolase protein [Microdochium trichocladiopsis]|uniref:P-loop containing nucleoside triphosphate hydrolase protein n=1 Tax=Microdochium trichocladiopsis TaxID=1682393 RepID=A0A9P8YCB6_9PEZI|nr:P-loop containing nucleoside triphosphate hydrolase protein [Microdochium trichocladiopsis]KAH7035766.1 P-loop containing nucleoside triphosphate hydrolase protein [Microdochium trichocladiopsis]